MAGLNASKDYTDTEIIAGILNGESRLYELLIRRNNPLLYRIGRSYRYNHQDTEDLMQETYIHAYSSLAKFQGRSSFKTWIARIMLNNCYHKKERSAFKMEQPLDELNDKMAPVFNQPDHYEKSLMNKELGRVVETALNKIPEDYRLVFTLRELNGFSVAETCEAISISESNVKVRLNRAKNMLRSEIEKMYSPEEIYEFNLIYCDRMVERVFAALENK